jgi:hypothetical protein
MAKLQLQQSTQVLTSRANLILLAGLPSAAVGLLTHWPLLLLLAAQQVLLPEPTAAAAAGGCCLSWCFLMAPSAQQQ